MRGLNIQVSVFVIFFELSNFIYLKGCGFLDFLDYMRTVILQDCVILKRNEAFKSLNSIFRLDIFSSEEFIKYERRFLEVHTEEETTHYQLLRKVYKICYVL